MLVRNAESPRHFGFLTLPAFSMMPFASAVEVLRLANDLGGEPHYRWTVYSLDGLPVVASNGLVVGQTEQLAEHSRPDILFVCADNEINARLDDRVLALLRDAARVHLELSVGLMLNLVTPRVGAELAGRISERLLDDASQTRRPRQSPGRPAFNHRALGEAVSLMEANIEEPLPLGELARKVALSERQLQRMFRHALGVTPTQHYLHVRLRHARVLLRETSLSIMEVTFACGFQSPCHFSNSYRAQFGCSPSGERGQTARMSRGEAFQVVMP